MKKDYEGPKVLVVTSVDDAKDRNLLCACDNLWEGDCGIRTTIYAVNYFCDYIRTKEILVAEKPNCIIFIGGDIEGNGQFARFLLRFFIAVPVMCIPFKKLENIKRVSLIVTDFAKMQF